MKTEPARPLPAAEALKQHMVNEVAAEQRAIDAASQQAEAIAGLAIGKVLATVAEVHARLEEINHVAPGADRDIDAPPERQFYSIGRCCELLGVLPAGLKAAMRHLGIRFTESRDEAGYLDGAALLAVHAYVTKLRGK